MKVNNFGPRLALCLLVVPLMTAPGAAPQESSKKTVAPGDLPAAVTNAFKERWPKAKLNKAAELTSGDAIKYELEIAIPRQGKTTTIEVTFDPNGKVLNWENPETRVKLAELPPSVLATARERFPGAEMLKAEKENEDGKTVFEITLVFKGQRLEAEFDPSGEYLEMEVSIELSKLPTAVKNALEERYPKATYRHAAMVTNKDGAVSYEVIVQTADGKRGEIVIGPDGRIEKGLER